MSDTSKDYVIVPSKINPKFGVVVNSIPYIEKKSMYRNPVQRALYHLENHRKSFEATITKEFPLIYNLNAIHLFHYLKCEIRMTVANQDDMGLCLVCDFPVIEDQVMNGFINDDEFMFACLLIHFQMYIMLELLIFCEHQKIENLILEVETEYVKELGIYEDIVSYENSSNSNGSKTKMIIDLNKISSTEWEKSITHAVKEFQKEMWAEQKHNISVREYLKINPFVDVFC